MIAFHKYGRSFFTFFSFLSNISFGITLDVTQIFKITDLIWAVSY